MMILKAENGVAVGFYVLRWVDPRSTPIPSLTVKRHCFDPIGITASVGIVTLSILFAFESSSATTKSSPPSESKKLINGGGHGSKRFAGNSTQE
ncbi:hypothetical protein ACE6H2_023138 [Prunus campanulata]